MRICSEGVSGRIINGQKVAIQQGCRIAVIPLMVIQKIGKVGGIQLFPDFNNILFSRIAGDYGFNRGIMQIRECRLEGDVANVAAQGTIDLVQEKLDLLVTAQVARLAPMDVEVKGTFEKPATKVKMGKFLAEPAKELLKRLIK